MKKVILAAFMSLIASLIYAGNGGANDGNDEKSEIDLTITNPPIGNNNGNERSIVTPYLNAYLFETSGIVEVELFGLGETHITVFNSLGQIVASDVAMANIPTVITLDLPSASGAYYIIIDSPEIYAQGWFVL
ncbi:MAG: hypothetical protein IKY70_07120 [Bacteroidales bacterium]|nr:hypothetical protein [Bacteroidales bacterium]